MRALRALSTLHRLVLVWFVLSLGSAIASPMVHPQTIELVCAGATVKMIVHTDDGAVEMGSTSLMDCPLCVLAGAPPPPPPQAVIALPLPLGHAVQSIPAARIAAATAAPLPARGPPFLG